MKAYMFDVDTCVQDINVHSVASVVAEIISESKRVVRPDEFAVLRNSG